MRMLLQSVGNGNALHVNDTPRAPDQPVSYEQKGKQWREQATQVSQMLHAEAETAAWELNSLYQESGVHRYCSWMCWQGFQLYL